MEARVPRQPAVDQRRLVGTRIVDNEMDVERSRDRRVKGLQERAELPGPVALGNSPMISPLVAFKAANSVVVPCRV